MTEPVKSKIRPEDATDTPRAEAESTQMLSESSNVGATPSDIRKIQEQLAKIEAGSRRRGRFLRDVAPLVPIFIAALAGAFFSWLLYLDRVKIVIKFVDYFGLLAIMITLIGAVVFFLVAIVTVRSSAETRVTRQELDEVRKTLSEFKNSVEPELERLISDVDEQHREIQDLKNLADIEKKSE